MTALRIPRFIRDLYNPTPRQWLRWLRFRRRVLQLARQGFAALYQYFDSCAKGRFPKSTGVSCGLHSSSSSTSLELFPWATFTRGESFQGTDLSVSVDTHDSDIRSIVYLNDW